MKFIISRTSLWNDEEKPCEEAIKDKYIRVDERTIDSPEKFNHKYERDNWFSEGTNHRIDNGHIKRDFEDEDWFIEINTLDDLIKFQQKYGDIIIQDGFMNPDIKEIEIYDSYRE